MSHSVYKLHMTIKPHLFYSFMVHALALAYLLSIPVYIGSEFSMTFGSYSVDLVSEERPAEKPARGYEPAKSRVLILKKQESQGKAEVKAAPEALEPEVTAEEKDDEIAVIPSGISLLEDKPKEETLLAKSDVEVQEQKQETLKEMNEMADESITKGEEKAEPAKPEPVWEETPPASRPQAEAVKTEALQVQEPKAVNVADEKPSKADMTDEQLQEQFPVKPDEKAPEVSPLTVKEKTLLPKKPPAEPAKEESPAVKEAGKPAAVGPVSEKKDEKKTGEGKGEGKDRKDIEDTSKSLRGEKAGTERAVTEPKPKNRKLEKGIGDNEKKGKNKGLKVASPLPGELSGKGGESFGTPSGGSTPTSNGSSGPQGDTSGTGDGKAQMDGTNGSGTKIARESAEKKPAMAIVVPLLTDIKVEVFLEGTDGRILSSQLYRRTHPSDEEDRKRSKEEIRLIREPDNEGKATFYVAKAGKGIYTFAVTNNGDILQKTDLVIRLLEGKKGARNRKFESIELAPHAEVKIKFILPEAIFWDDESYFTGIIESSESISKFNDMSGIVWKEEKE